MRVQPTDCFGEVPNASPGPDCYIGLVTVRLMQQVVGGMTSDAKKISAQVEPFPKVPVARGLNEQLEQLRDLLCAEFPQATDVSLGYDGQLRVYIDVRRGEDIMLIEARVPGLPIGEVVRIARGRAPHHPFLYRITVTLER